MTHAKHHPNRAWVLAVSRQGERYERVVCFCASEAEARALVTLANRHAPPDILYWAEDWYRCVCFGDSLGDLPTAEEEALWLAAHPPTLDEVEPPNPILRFLGSASRRRRR